MSGLAGFKAGNHRQQTAKRGARSDIDDRATTPEMFAELDDRFVFSVDVAASAANAKCSRYYDVEANGLAQSWEGERVWCNPPYSDIRPWVEKATAETRAELIVMLLPANRTESAWWHEFVEPNRDYGGRMRVEFLRHRRRFVRPGQTAVLPNDRPPFGVCLLIWGEVSP